MGVNAANRIFIPLRRAGLGGAQQRERRPRTKTALSLAGLRCAGGGAGGCTRLISNINIFDEKF